MVGVRRVARQIVGSSEPEVVLTRVADEAADPGGGLGYWDSTLYEKLERSIGRLPDNKREVLFLRAFENNSIQEAAAALGKTPEAASKLYNRARSRLGILLSGITER